jgi:hypothetical protein
VGTAVGATVGAEAGTGVGAAAAVGDAVGESLGVPNTLIHIAGEIGDETTGVGSSGTVVTTAPSKALIHIAGVVSSGDMVTTAPPKALIHIAGEIGAESTGVMPSGAVVTNAPAETSIVIAGEIRDEEVVSAGAAPAEALTDIAGEIGGDNEAVVALSTAVTTVPAAGPSAIAGEIGDNDKAEVLSAVALIIIANITGDDKQTGVLPSVVVSKAIVMRILLNFLLKNSVFAFVSSPRSSGEVHCVVSYSHMSIFIPSNFVAWWYA